MHIYRKIFNVKYSVLTIIWSSLSSEVSDKKVLQIWGIYTLQPWMTSSRSTSAPDDSETPKMGSRGNGRIALSSQ